MSNALNDARSASALGPDGVPLHRRHRRDRHHSSSGRSRSHLADGDRSIDVDSTVTSHADMQRSAADNAIGIRFDKDPVIHRSDRDSSEVVSHRHRRSHSRSRSSSHRPRRRHHHHRHHRSHHHGDEGEEDEEARRERRRARRERHERRARRASSGVGSITSGATDATRRRRHHRRSLRSDADTLGGHSTYSRASVGPGRASALGELTEEGPSPVDAQEETRELRSARRSRREPALENKELLQQSDSTALERDTGAVTLGMGAGAMAGAGLAPARRLFSFRGLSALRPDPVKQQKKFEADQLKKQRKEEAQRLKREAAEVRAAEREKLIRMRKNAALIKQQKKDAEKARQKQAKAEAKQDAEAARQAQASEALMLAQNRERERELAEMDRKQRRLTSITPFRQRNPTLDGHVLTPLHRHTFIKSLVMMQMQSEWLTLARRGVVGLYGYPFTQSQPRGKQSGWKSLPGFHKQAVDGDAPKSFSPDEEPLILRHMFQVHLRHFPGLWTAPVTYWQTRIQRLMDQFVSHALSSSRERAQIVLTHLLSLIGTQYLGLFFARGVGVRGMDELRGPGVGEPGTEQWGVGKHWGAGTVKRGLAQPYVLTREDMRLIDSLYEGDDLRAWKAAGVEASRVCDDWAAFKEKIIEQEDGMNEMVDYLNISNVNNLPIELQNAEEWVRIHIALMFRFIFVQAPQADTIFEVVRVIHNIVPYWAIKQALSVANAKTMVQLLLTILLARPAGADSLLQRIVSYAFTRECSTLQKSVIEPIRHELSNIMLVNKLEAYVRDRTAEEVVRMEEDSLATGNDMVTTILLSRREPVLDMETHDHIMAMQKAFAMSPFRANLDLAYPGSTPQGQNKPPIPSTWDVPPGEMSDAREFALLKLYLRSMLQKRDRIEIAKWFSSGVFVQFIKDSLQHVFYRGLQAVSRSADLGGRLMDLKELIQDMIEVRRNTDNATELWIGLANKHHEFIYFFVHEIAPVMGPVWKWCQEALDFMSLSTSDPQRPEDRRAQDIELNPDEMLQDERLSDDDLREIVKEMDDVVEYSRWNKIRRNVEFRRLFLLSKQDNLDMRMSAAMREDMSDVDGLMAELLDKEGVPIDDGRCDDVRGTERRAMPWAYFDVVDPLGQSLMSEPEVPFSFKPTRVGPRPPTLYHTRKVLPMFRELLVSELPDWLDPELNGPPQPSAKNLKLSSIQMLRQTRQ